MELTRVCCFGFGYHFQRCPDLINSFLKMFELHRRNPGFLVSDRPASNLCDNQSDSRHWQCSSIEVSVAHGCGIFVAINMVY